MQAQYQCSLHYVERQTVVTGCMYVTNSLADAEIYVTQCVHQGRPTHVQILAGSVICGAQPLDRTAACLPLCARTNCIATPHTMCLPGAPWLGHACLPCLGRRCPALPIPGRPGSCSSRGSSWGRHSGCATCSAADVRLRHSLQPDRASTSCAKDMLLSHAIPKRSITWCAEDTVTLTQVCYSSSKAAAGATYHMDPSTSITQGVRFSLES